MPNLYTRPNSPYLWCWGRYPDGSRWRRSTGQTTPRAAATAARSIEREELARFGRPRVVTLGEAIGVLREHKQRKGVADPTLEILRTKAKALGRVFGLERDVGALTLADCQVYLDERRKEGASDHTISKELSHLVQALRQLHRHGLYPGEPRAIWPDELRDVYTPRTRWLTLEEYERLLVEVTPHRRRYVTLYVYTGVRFSELYRARRAGDVLLVEQHKGERKVRPVPLAAPAAEVLDADPLPWKVWQRGRMGADLKAACARAKMARVSANDLRRTFASWLCNAGVPELTTIRLMGHTSSQMVRRVYAQLAPTTLRDAIDRLPVCQLCARTDHGIAETPEKT